MFKDVIFARYRPLIYSIFVGVSFFTLGIVRNFLDINNFFAWSFISYLIVLLELFVTSNHYHIIKRKNAKIAYEFDKHKILQYIHHLLFPSILFFSIVGFIYFNYHLSFLFFISFFSFFLFLILFLNLYSYYHHNFAIHKNTNYIYDFLTGVLIFFNSNLLLNFKKSFSLDFIIVMLIWIIILLFYGLLLNFRHIFDKISIYALGIFILLNLWLLFLLLFLDLNPVNVSIFLSLSFVSYLYYISHITSNTLNWKTFGEFFSVILLILSLIGLYRT